MCNLRVIFACEFKYDNDLSTCNQEYFNAPDDFILYNLSLVLRIFCIKHGVSLFQWLSNFSKVIEDRLLEIRVTFQYSPDHDLILEFFGLETLNAREGCCRGN